MYSWHSWSQAFKYTSISLVKKLLMRSNSAKQDEWQSRFCACAVKYTAKQPHKCISSSNKCVFQELLTPQQDSDTSLAARTHQPPFNCQSKCGVLSGNKRLPLWCCRTPVLDWKHRRTLCGTEVTGIWTLADAFRQGFCLSLVVKQTRLCTRGALNATFMWGVVQMWCFDVLHSGTCLVAIFNFCLTVSGHCVLMSGFWCLIGLLGNTQLLLLHH